MRVLIVDDGASRGTLAAARSLAASGAVVGVAEFRSAGLTGASRFVSARHRLPDAALGPRAFARGVAEVVRAGRYDVVFGSGDAEVLALSAVRDEIPAAIGYGPHESVVRALDKGEVAAAASAAGIAVPASALPEEAGDLLRSGPVVVKARVHADPAWPGSGPARQEAVVAHDRGAVERRAASIRAGGGVPFVQPLVGGTLMALVLLIDRRGDAVGAMQQEASRINPPLVGASVRATSRRVDPELAEAGRRLLGALGWFGLAELQFVRPGDGAPLLIDLNGRFYGSLSLAIEAGVDFPRAWADLALGRRVAPLPPPVPGVRYQWLEGDLRRARAERRGGLARDVLSCLRYAPGAVHSVWRAGDPRPFARRALQIVRAAFDPPPVTVGSSARG